MIPRVSEKNVPSIYPYPYLISKNNIRSNAKPQVSIKTKKFEPRTRSSSSVFDLRRLGKFGFGRLQDRQLNALGLPKKVVQDSIDAFADAMDKNKSFEGGIVCKIRYFMYLMRRDGCFARLAKDKEKKKLIETPEYIEYRKKVDHIRENGDGRYDDVLKPLTLKANTENTELHVLLRNLAINQANTLSNQLPFI